MLPVLETKDSTAKSKALAALQPVVNDWIDLWYSSRTSDLLTLGDDGLTQS